MFIILNYDYRTCEGRYKPIENQVSDRNGTVFFWSFPYFFQPAIFRYFVIQSNGYARTGSYSSSSHQVVWLIPDNAPLSSQEAAINYISQEKLIEQIIAFYHSKGMRTEYLYAKEAYYGVWRVTIDVARPTIRNGQNLKIVEGRWTHHGGISVFVHPGNYEYIIRNRWKDKVSNEIPLIGLEEGEESSFLNNLANTYPHKFGAKGFGPELLIERTQTSALKKSFK